MKTEKCDPVFKISHGRHYFLDLLFVNAGVKNKFKD